ncbi:MAG: hypothetical protein WBN22_01645 [Verrucomicrobiia bacterium]
MSAPDGNRAAKTGVTPGRPSSSDHGSWDGKWTLLMPDKPGPKPMP